MSDNNSSLEKSGLSQVIQKNLGYGSAVAFDENKPTEIDRNYQRSYHEAETEAVTLSWENIRATLQAKKSLFKNVGSSLEILKGVSGIAKSGNLLAIMGASGSGKTTLLNVLTNRNTGRLQIGGQVKVNGVNMGTSISKVAAYVQQEDLFVGVLTVYQHLWFQAMLRMDQNTTIKQRKSRVDGVIRELGLQKCKNSVIGVPNKVKSLSGGERKRLAFASEVLMNPSIMFCDEPTSGLDSFMAESVVHTLKMLAGKGKTIVCTIHQPSSEIFTLFDNLILLAEGNVMYLGSANDAKSFFSSIGFSCPTQYNPADFYIRTLAITPGKEIESRERLTAIGRKFNESEIGQKLQSEISEAAKTNSIIVCYFFRRTTMFIFLKSPAVGFSSTSKFKANYWSQLRYVGWRSFLSANKDFAVVGIRVMQNIVIALMSGLVFLGQKNNQKGVQNINGSLFLMATNMTFGNAFGVIMVLFSLFFM